MNEILRHGGENNFLLAHTKKQQHEKKMGASFCAIAANVLSFLLTKASQTTFVFDKNTFHSNNYTINESTKEGITTQMTKTTTKTKQVRRFHGIAI